MPNCPSKPGEPAAAGLIVSLHIVNQYELHPTVDDDSTAALRAAVAAADRAADGDSNDAEIDALRDALTLALTRWPELHHLSGPTVRPADATGPDEPANASPPRTPTMADTDTRAATCVELDTAADHRSSDDAG